MAGKVQHEIPQLYQRGFLIAGAQPAERIFVFRKNGISFASNIDRAGAESYFYSGLATDDSRTLDDKITDYENRLGALVQQLRSAPTGTRIDSCVAAEVIAHLTTRNAHLRGAFSYGIQTLTKRAMHMFGDENNIRRLMGIDSPAISEVFRNRFIEHLVGEARKAGVDMPAALLERFAFAAIREGFPSFVEQQIPAIGTVLSQLMKETSTRVRDAHNSALDKTFSPDIPITNLSSLTWQIDETNFDLILPDCVALAIEAEEGIQPLMMADFKDVEMVLLPLTSRSLLIGKRTAIQQFDPAVFNRAAAACSHTYFLAGSNGPELLGLSYVIGTRSVTLVDTAIDESLRSYVSPEEGNVGTTGLAEIALPKSLQVQVTYIGDFDPNLLKEIDYAISCLLGEVAWTVPLDRLDGITFADDYPAALLSLDRGDQRISPPETRQDSVAFGIAQCPIIIRNGVIKSHVVVLGNIGRMLVGDGDTNRRWAASVLADQLAQAGVTQIVDETLPGVLLNLECRDLEGDLHACTYPAWNSYFAARASAGFEAARLAETQGVLLLALRDAFAEVPKARLAYRLHGNLRQLLDIALSKIRFVLEYAANVLGYADGTDREPMEGAEELRAELECRELLAWYYDYGRDLAYLWDRRGEWKSYDEFLALNRHAERLLWPFAIVPWTNTEGQYRVEVPLYVDANALEKDGRGTNPRAGAEPTDA
jgi:hypothetical protein